MNKTSLKKILQKKLMIYISSILFGGLIILLILTTYQIIKTNERDRLTVINIVESQATHFFEEFATEVETIEVYYLEDQTSLLHEFYQVEKGAFRLEKMEFLNQDGYLLDILPYDSLRIGFDYSQTPGYLTAKEAGEDISIGDMVYDVELGLNILPIVKKTRDGYLVGYFANQELEQMMNDINIDDGYIAIVDHAGKYIAHSDDDFVKERRIDENYMKIDEIKTNTLLTYNDSKYFLSYKVIEGTDITVMYYQNASWVIDIIIYVVGLILLIMGIISFISRVLISRVLQRLNNEFDNLTKVTQMIGEGIYNYDVEGDIYIEIEPLINSFKFMSEEVEQREEEIEDLSHEIEKNFYLTISLMAKAIEAKDLYTGNHCERVRDFSVLIGEEIGLNEKQIKDLRYGGILHDIGKIGIAESVLNKPGILNNEEYEMMKSHPEIGAKLLDEVPLLKDAIDIIKYHHEFVDGTGYPDGLKGDEIPYLARIVSIADAFDAMTSIRPYRDSAMTYEMAIEEIKRCSGTQFDETLVQAFIKILQLNSDL